MRMTITKNNKLSVFLLLLLSTTLVAATPARVIDLSRSNDYSRLLRELPESWDVELLPEQSFINEREMVRFAAGVARSDELPGKSDCFLYTMRKGQVGKLTFLSKRAEDIWHCVGASTLALRKYSKGSHSILILLSIFEYQAPSGEIFKFPFLLDAHDSSNFEVSGLNDCVSAQLHGVILLRLSQLEAPIKTCTGMQRDFSIKK
jgi:hypothetical protein